MSLLSSNQSILKNKDVEVQGKISLNLSYQDQRLNIAERLIKDKEEIERKISEASKEYEKIIKDTQEQKINIIKEAEEKSKSIEKKAYERGYNEGLKNGYEDGFKESYEKNIEKARCESEKIKEEGYKTLLNIKSEAASYMKENKSQILEISIKIAEQVLRESFQDKASMNNLLENIIREYDLKRDLIIKANPVYTEELKKHLTEMITKFNLSQKIFVMPDAKITQGNAEIETKSGKLIVGIDSVLERVREELL